MAYNALPTVATSDSWTASQHNTYIKDNFAAVWVGTTAGDMDYYSSSTTKTRLAKPSGLGLFQNDSSGVPSYHTGGSANDMLKKNSANNAFEWGHPFIKFASVYHNTTQTIPATGSALSILFNSEEADANGWHSTSSNTDRITPTVSGVYKAGVQLEVSTVGGANNAVWVKIYKNNSTIIGSWRNTTLASFLIQINIASRPISMNGSTDYINVTIEHNNAGTLTLSSNPYFWVERKQ